MKLPPARSYPLPYPFPPGAAWASIRNGDVTNMVYMQVPDGLSFAIHRQRARGDLARHGVVWSGRVEGDQFIPAFESTDIRQSGLCNTARCAL